MALIAFFAGGYLERSEHFESDQASLKQLQAREQIIQSQEAQLVQTRQQLNDSSSQLAEMKGKFEESQRELVATKQRLGATIREVARLNTSLAAASRRAASRAPDTAPSFPSAAQRPAAEPGVYETTRATSVYENPSSAARVITQIRGGTRINVVSSTGGWLAVRSKRGNPPGYVWANDARLIARSN